MFFPDPWAQPTPGQYIAALRFRVDVPQLAAAMRKSLSEANFSGINFDVEEMMGKSIDDLLAKMDAFFTVSSPKQSITPCTKTQYRTP